MTLNAPAKITELTNESVSIAGLVDYASHSGAVLGLRVQRQFRTGTLLRVDLKNSLLLGEVMREEARDDGYLVHMRIEHSLPNLSELREVMGELEWLPPVPPVLSRAS